MQPPQGPPQIPPTPEQQPVLSFAEFSRRDPKYNHPRYNNFYVIFSHGGEISREHEWYKRFEKEHPDMASSLCDKIQNQMDKSIGEGEALKPFDRELYEAYVILHGYGISNEDLGMTY